jgi:hypothetical protein
VVSIKTGIGPILWVYALCALWGCTERSSATGQEENSPAEAELLGTWETEGVDPVLGSVRVRMRIEEEGLLMMTLLMETGGQRSFPGTWLVEGDEWVLRGVYFGEDGEQRVRWQVENGGRLIVTDEQGLQQVWIRV